MNDRGIKHVLQTYFLGLLLLVFITEFLNLIGDLHLKVKNGIYVNLDLKGTFPTHFAMKKYKYRVPNKFLSKCISSTHILCLINNISKNYSCLYSQTKWQILLAR